jgi:indole-3-glycerol phosphate synthase
MPSKLDEIVENKRHEVAERKRVSSVDSLVPLAQAGDGRFLAALQEKGPNLITEIKPKSPSAGVLRAEVSLEQILAAYNKYAAAISVLTDKKYFDGSLELLAEVAAKSSLPTLCKDFIIDPLQCYEARIARAQAVLLIVKILDDASLKTLYDTVQSLGMTAVVEVQTEEEMRRARDINAQCVLINNRNLSTFEIDLATTERLVPFAPAKAVVISASGIQTRHDIERILPFCSNFLIGSSLMQADDIGAKLGELLTPESQFAQSAREPKA